MTTETKATRTPKTPRTPKAAKVAKNPQNALTGRLNTRITKEIQDRLAYAYSLVDLNVTDKSAVVRDALMATLSPVPEGWVAKTVSEESMSDSDEDDWMKYL